MVIAAGRIAVVACAFALFACGGADDAQRSSATDATAKADSAAEEATDPVDTSAPPVEVTEPAACLTGRVCAADADCEKAERCNTTLKPPSCQVLYCATEGQACDPAHGDTLCEPDLACADAAEPYCCRPACTGKACGPDGCGGSCGACACGEGCEQGTCAFVACDDRECGDDGCGGNCGTCAGAHDACLDGACICQPACEGRDCGDDGCGGDCGECVVGSECGACVALHTDPVAGLTWRLKVGSPLAWTDAMDFCGSSQSELPGQGWRLPDIDELRTLIEGCAKNEPTGSCTITATCQSDCLGSCEGCAFGGGPSRGSTYLAEPFETDSFTCWSSTSYPDDLTRAYLVGFNTGVVSTENKSYARGVPCVRSLE